MSVDVSVIIAAYNAENFIADTIQSALDQSGVSLEILVIDDMSTDKTVDIVTALSKNNPRIRLLQMPVNGGPAAARNAGFAEAAGTWIAVLDADDAYTENRLARCVEKAEEMSAAMVVDNIRVDHEETGQSFPMFDPDIFAGFKKMDLETFIKGKLRKEGTYTLGYLKPVFSNAFLKQFGLSYDLSLRIGEDYLLFAEILANGGLCAVVPECGYIYRSRPGSISHRLKPVDVQRIIEADARFINQYALSDVQAVTQAKRERELKELYAWCCFVEGVKTRNLKTTLNAIIACPAALKYLKEPVLKRLKRVRSARGQNSSCKAA